MLPGFKALRYVFHLHMQQVESGVFIYRRDKFYFLKITFSIFNLISVGKASDELNQCPPPPPQLCDIYNKLHQRFIRGCWWPLLHLFIYLFILHFYFKPYSYY